MFNKTKFYYEKKSTFILMVIIGVTFCLSGCATFNDDPWEGFNRPMHNFNDRLDRSILKPTAQLYRDITPSGFRDSVNNFFNNINEPYSMINNILQGNFANAGKNLGRFLINSTVGILGLFDVAGVDMKIKSTNEDFGQTLGVWGINTGPYLVLPFLGPGNLRDTITSFGVDRKYNILAKKVAGDGASLYFMQAFSAVRARERALDAEEFAKGMSLDKYILYRGIFKQNRLNQVYNDNPPKVIKKEEDESWLDE